MAEAPPATAAVPALDAQQQQQQQRPSLTPSESAFAEGLASLLSPLVGEMDTGVQAVVESQSALHHQLDLLARELKRFFDLSNPPADLEAYMKKLIVARKRLDSVASIVKDVQDRTERLQGSVAKDLKRRADAQAKAASSVRT